MGKEVVTLEVDADLMARLRAVGIEPAEYLERMLRREAALNETPEQRKVRGDAWRREHQAELDSYDEFIRANGIWSDGLRQF